ncbi:conserved exported hypothetical protein [Desulfosarcina cetonica]|uniref:transporter n=1 Tax=Desulfosarcina cetonica TaxID=90730 RepID=UPI0006D0184E|nr:transporter [Desulfosarcina cetonica]VTR71391.1 conserved exported hypothetical protein [Desulfosarcina cetonica]
MNKKCLMVVTIFVFSLITGIEISSADDDARDYIAAPPGTNVLAIYYKHISGHNAYCDGEKVGSDTNLGMNLGIFRPIFYTNIGPFTIDPQVLIIFGDASLDGQDVGGVEYSTSGLADPVLAATLWLVNNPESQTWFGITPFVTVPIGEYDNDDVLNMGKNRWAFKGEFGFVKGFGDFYFDLVGNVEFFTDNESYTSADLTLEQDPIYTLETHLSYDINASFFVSADYYYHNGGETTVAGTEQDDEQNDHTAQLTLGLKPAPNFQFLIQYGEDIKVENGVKENTFGLRMLYIF